MADDERSVKEVTDETIAKGGVLALLYFDIHGDSKEKVEGLIVDLAGRITKEKGVVYAVSEIERAMEMEENKFSAAAEVKVLTDSFTSLARLCGMYGPMGVEIVKPNDIRLSIQDAHSLLFLIAQMGHEFATTMLYKRLSPEEIKKLEEKLKKREELGKKLIEKGEEGAGEETKESK